VKPPPGEFEREILQVQASSPVVGGAMQAHQNCSGLDVHKQTIAAC
jgi:hypothetical protein